MLEDDGASMAPPVLVESPGVTVYQALVEDVRTHIRQLRVILDAAEARSKERAWLRNQTEGELDDGRLVDGLAGERHVFKRRGIPDVPVGRFQAKPKRLHFAIDVSASMARGNGWDGRLDRLCQSVVMLMEALPEGKYTYAIVGHSGAGPNVRFVEHGRPPRTEEERYDVIRSMRAHAQGAPAGDSTILAAQRGVRELSDERLEADDRLLFVISDANLGRYGMDPQDLADALVKDNKDVEAHVMFLAEPQAAEWLVEKLPIGQAHVVMDLGKVVMKVKEVVSRVG